MDEKEFLKKLIAGKYFKEGDYFTEKQLENFKPFISDFRKILDDKGKKNYFRNTIASLISSYDIRKVLVGLNFGRYYLDDKEIYLKLRELVDNPPDNSFRIKVQSIYELLVEESTDKDKKQEWYEFLISNLEEYNKLFRQTYRILKDEDKRKYFNILLQKLSKTQDNKKWVYLIELVTLGINKKETARAIKHVNSKDEFVLKVVKECLQRL